MAKIKIGPEDFNYLKIVEGKVECPDCGSGVWKKKLTDREGTVNYSCICGYGPLTSPEDKRFE